MILVNKDVSIDYLKIFDYIDISEVTRNEYKARIKKFMNFLQQNKFNKNSYLEYKRHLKKRNDYTVSTKNKYLITAKVFLKELNRQGIIDRDITNNIKGFTDSKKHKKTGINTTELIKIVNYLNSGNNTVNNIELKLLVCLKAFQGLRDIEINRLNVNDIDDNDQALLVTGKGQDHKVKIYLLPDTYRILKFYLQIKNIKTGAIFISNSNNSKNKRLTTRSIRRKIKQLFKKLDISKTGHGFRHYFTTELIKKFNGNLIKVSQFTRHNNLEMLQVYNDELITKEDLPDFFDTFKNVSIA